MEKDELQQEGAEETLDDDVLEEEIDNLSEDTSEDDIESIKSEAAKWRNIAIRRKKKLEELSQKGEKEETADTTEKSSDDKLDRIEFALRHKDLDYDQIETIFKFSKVEGISPEEVLKNDTIKKVIEEQAREKKIAEASVVGSPSSHKQEKSLIEKVKSGELSDEEFKKNYQRIVEEFSKK